MTAKTKTQIEEMKNQTIGVEVEMNSITRENAAKLAAGVWSPKPMCMWTPHPRAASLLAPVLRNLRMSSCRVSMSA